MINHPLIIFFFFFLILFLSRKNPVHFREYSHDFAANYSDSDGEDEANETVKPLCPYGRSCYRKNPAHFAEYTHSLKGWLQKFLIINFIYEVCCPLREKKKKK